MKKLLLLSFASVAATLAFGAGFGLYEASSRGNAMAGALVGKTGDATANYFNPAALTDTTNVSVYAGFTLINPFCDHKVYSAKQAKMNAGWFFAPTFYLSVPVTDDLVLGWGNYAEYGLGTKYKDGWALAYDTTETTIEQYTMNPNIAYKITDWWSVSAGLRVSYITFENYAQPLSGLGVPNKSHLKGDDWGLGFVLGSKFKITDNIHAGIVYRSRIKHNIEGDFSLPGVTSGDASAKLTLPSSVTTGVNWDITDDWRVGATIIWTEWSTVDMIDFQLPGTASHRQRLDFKNAFRYGMATEYDFTDWLQGRLGYVYDLDPSHENRGTTMLPAGDRHIITSGLGFQLTENLKLDVGLSFICMERSERFIQPRAGQTFGQSGMWRCRNSFSYLVSAGLTYNF
jgi:long-chain fatty acid transport protein